MLTGAEVDGQRQAPLDARIAEAHVVVEQFILGPATLIELRTGRTGQVWTADER